MQKECSKRCAKSQKQESDAWGDEGGSQPGHEGELGLRYPEVRLLQASVAAYLGGQVVLVVQN